MTVLGEISAAYALGEAVFGAALQNKWLRGRVERRGRRKVFDEVWRGYVAGLPLLQEDPLPRLYLGAALNSETFQELVDDAMKGDWRPPKDLGTEDVLSDLRRIFSDSAISRTASDDGPLVDVRVQFMRRVQAVLDDQKFADWYRRTVSDFFDRLYAEYEKTQELGVIQERYLWEFQKNQMAIEEVKSLCRTGISLLIAYAAFTVGASAVDFMVDHAFDTPGIDGIVAASGTALAGVVAWVRQRARAIPRSSGAK